jgi:hypothetical protein
MKLNISKNKKDWEKMAKKKDKTKKKKIKKKIHQTKIRIKSRKKKKKKPYWINRPSRLMKKIKNK